MNRLRAKELLPIIKAFANGETIQRYVLARKWEDVITGAPFSDDVDYRIKPKGPREFWLWDTQPIFGTATGMVHWSDSQPIHIDAHVIKVREVISDD